MAHDSFRAALASRVKSQDQVERTLAGICVSATRMYNFSAGISMDPGERRESWRDPGKILVPILLGRCQSRWENLDRAQYPF